MTRRIVAVGEIVWDLFPAGRQLGGSPANFAVHAHGLGGDVALVSRVGADALGREALAVLRERGMSLEALQIDAEARTGTVDVTVAGDGQPEYRIVENVAWDYIEADATALRAAAAADAFCFGSLAQRGDSSRRAIRSLLAATRPDCLRLFDVNRRMPYWSAAVVTESLSLANAVKLNDVELTVLTEMFGLPADERTAIAQLATRYSLKLTALTRGAKGSLLYAGGEWSDRPALKVDVRDAVGAGDAFTAALTLGYLAGWSLDRINAHALAVAAWVCLHPGATPLLPGELRIEGG